MPVYFDNIQLTHQRGPLLEENAYYPFGLTIAGLSSKALSFGKENKKKYNGYELENSFDLNLYESFYRTHDPQLGRWWQIDPKVDKFYNLSTYCSMANNPILIIDPLGDEIWIQIGKKKYKWNEEDGKLYNKKGKEYTGDDKFAMTVTKNLQKMNETEAGKKMLKELSESSTESTFLNKKDPSGGTASHSKGKIYAAKIMEEGTSDAQKLKIISHEAFHGYQYSKGTISQSVQSEVEAYMFSSTIAHQSGTQKLNSDSRNNYFGVPGGMYNFGEIYEQNMRDLLFKGFDRSVFNSASSAFKRGSLVNLSGEYNSYSDDEGFITLIQNFYPLIK